MNKPEIGPEKPKIKIDIRENGDLYVISGLEKEELLNLAVRIFGQFQPNEDNLKIRESFEKGGIEGELRPQGCFAMKIINLEGGDQLWIENRNARGYKPATEQLKRAVESVVSF